MSHTASINGHGGSAHCHSVQPSFAVCGGVLQCVAVCCGVLRCVVVCCSVLQCVAVCCSVLQGVMPSTIVACLIFVGYLPQRSPVFSGYFAERDLQLEASDVSSPPCRGP